MTPELMAITAIQWIRAQPAVAGSVVGAAIMSGVFMIVSKDALAAGCYVAGRAVSAFVTHRFGKWGRKIEDAVQCRVMIAVDQFFRGLDADDKASAGAGSDTVS